MSSTRDRQKRVNAMIQLTLAGTESRFMTTKQAAQSLADHNHFSDGKEGIKERALFVRGLNKRKRRVNLVISFEFAHEMKSKGKVALNVMEALAEAVEHTRISTNGTHIKKFTIITEDGVPLEKVFK